MKIMTNILVLHGPNLNLLGTREPEIYGTETLDDIDTQIRELAQKLKVTIEIKQSNSEETLIEEIHNARNWANGILFNPGAFTHTSIALMDAIASIEIPVVEIHISNIHNRETFRRESVIAPACLGSVSGFGPTSYLIGLRGITAHIQ